MCALCSKLFKHMLLVRNMLNTDKRPINLYLNPGQFISQESFYTLLFSWVGGTAATAPDCKSGTQETSEVRALFYPLYIIENEKKKVGE